MLKGRIEVHVQRYRCPSCGATYFEEHADPSARLRAGRPPQAITLQPVGLLANGRTCDVAPEGLLQRIGRTRPAPGRRSPAGSALVAMALTRATLEISGIGVTGMFFPALRFGKRRVGEGGRTSTRNARGFGKGRRCPDEERRRR